MRPREHLNEVATTRRHARRILLGQLGVTLVVAAASALIWGRGAGMSALIGGMIGVTATGYMAFSLLRHGPGTPAGRIARSFFLGWVVKVAMTIALLVIAFRAPGVTPLALLAAYVATFVVYWLVAARTPRL